VKSISELNKPKVRLFTEAVRNEGRLELIDELIAANYIGHIPCTETPVTGPEGVRQLVSARRRADPGLHITIEDQIAEEEQTVTVWQATATAPSAPPAPNGRTPAMQESPSCGSSPESKSTRAPNARASPPNGRPARNRITDRPRDQPHTAYQPAPRHSKITLAAAGTGLHPQACHCRRRGQTSMPHDG
jgi:SnoaL-like polyketide cyclase